MEGGIVTPEILRNHVEIHLRGHAPFAYCETDDSQIRRLYIRSLGLLSSVRSEYWRMSLHFGELIRLSAFITGVDGIQRFFITNETIYHRIIQHYADEKHDKSEKKESLKTIDPVFVDWFPTNEAKRDIPSSTACSL